MFAATVTLLAIYLLLHYSTRDLFACDLPDIYLVQAEHIGSGYGRSSYRHASNVLHAREPSAASEIYELVTL